MGISEAHAATLAALKICAPREKAAAAHAIYARWRAGEFGEFPERAELNVRPADTIDSAHGRSHNAPAIPNALHAVAPGSHAVAPGSIGAPPYGAPTPFDTPPATAHASANVASQHASLVADALRAFAAPAHDFSGVPGRPLKPELIHPSKVPQRKLGSVAGRAALVHAVAHIEFNAINLALDAAVRFGAAMPAQYTADWLLVAAEEAHHHVLLADRLEALGFRYGDFPAHNGLWEMAEKTADDVLARMALVPRILEARGLDVTPLIQKKLNAVGDKETVAILDIILKDEVGHVAIGNRWFRYLCDARGLSPEKVFPQLMAQYDAPSIRPPFNAPARLKGGFTQAELDWLAQGAGAAARGTGAAATLTPG
jgi:uncharacterized ferritin-like protein (DUF455 family)